MPLIKLCFSGAYTEEELIKKVQRASEMTGYLGTNDLQKCERLIKEEDEYAALVLESMAYRVSKEIGGHGAVLEGRVDAIILTGGLAKSVRFTGCIKQRVSLIAPIEESSPARRKCSPWPRARCGCFGARNRPRTIERTNRHARTARTQTQRTAGRSSKRPFSSSRTLPPSASGATRFCYPSFCKVKRGGTVADLGAGNGIIALLVAAHTDASKIVGIEIQERAADMARRSAGF